MDSFEQELKTGFLDEVRQCLADTEQCFLDLEKAADKVSLLEKIFRLAHNIKGSANAVGFSELGAFTHEFESLLLRLKKGEMEPNPGVIDLLLRCNDHLIRFIDTLKSNPEAHVDSGEILNEIHDRIAGKCPSVDPQPQVAIAAPEAPETTPQAEPEPEPEPEPSAQQEPSEIEAPPTQEEELGNALAEITELKLKNEPSAPEAPAFQAPMPATPPAPPASLVSNADESIRVSISRLENLLNFVGEMVILQSVLREQTNGQNSVLLKKTVHQISKVTKEVQDITMSLRMIPLRQTFQKMQRIVRDTSKALGKNIEFNTSGDETELDKNVLDQLGDPLVHLIRNAVDHGIESEAERLAAGKSPHGTIRLNAYNRVGQIIIEISDDGRGLDAGKLVANAIKKGRLKPNEKLTDEQAYQLIFAPGFSTKEVVTDVSGRGVGMDVVRTNLDRLRGEIQIETKVNVGTTFRIRLPLSLAIIEGMVVKNGKERYVIPLNHVSESVDQSEMNIKKSAGIGDILMLRGEPIPIRSLAQLLDRANSNDNATSQTALIIRTLEKPFAVLVDEIIGQQQIVIKPLGSEVRQYRAFSGSAILGDGFPSLILDFSELMKKVMRNTGTAHRSSQTSISANPEKQRSHAA